MNILLLNDAMFRTYLERDHTVRACGPATSYPMPGQDRFDFTLPNRTELPLNEILGELEPFVPDVILHSETTTNYFFRGIEDAPCPTIWRTIDNHIHQWQPRYATAYDVVLVAQKDALPAFQALHTAAFWFPLHCFPEIHQNRGMQRDLDVVFVGSVDERFPERRRFLEALRQKVPLQIFSGCNALELSNLYNRAKIVVNQCLAGDLNYRVFEAMANGALLLTPDISNGQLDLFGNLEHLITYENGNVDRAAQCCHDYLENDLGRIRIASAGHRRVMEQHTVEARVSRLLQLIHHTLPEAFQSRSRRYNALMLEQLLLVYVALYRQRYISRTMVGDALERLEQVDSGAAARWMQIF